MKKKILGILLCGVLIIGLTGCGDNKKENQDNLNQESQDNQNNASETKSIILTCTSTKEGDGSDDNPTIIITQEFTIDNDSNLISIKRVVEFDYYSETKAQETYELNQPVVDAENRKAGETATAKVENNKYIITELVDMKIYDKEGLSSLMKESIDSNNKFSFSKYKSAFTEAYNGANPICTEK